MRIRITKPGIFGAGGEIPIDSEFTVTEEPTGWAGRYVVVSGHDEAEPLIINPEMGEVPTGDTTENPKTGYDPQAPAGEDAKDAASTSPYAVKEKSRGWFAITKDGEEVTKSLREDAVAGFEGKSDDEKAAFVDANKAEG